MVGKRKHQPALARERAGLSFSCSGSVDHGTYEARGGEIWLAPKTGNPRKVAEGFYDISAVAVSSDRWRLYIGDRRQRYLLSMTIAPDGSLRDLRKVNVLHIATGSIVIGAQDSAGNLQSASHICG